MPGILQTLWMLSSVSFLRHDAEYRAILGEFSCNMKPVGKMEGQILGKIPEIPFEILWMPSNQISIIVGK